MSLIYHCLSLPRRALVLLSLCLIVCGWSHQVSAQCTGCTTTISTNTSFTINSGQVVCLTYAGTFNQSINFNGGTLCVGPSTTVSTGINLNSGCSLILNGKLTGSLNQNNGSSVTVTSTGSITTTSVNFNGGSFTSSGKLVFTGSVNVSSNMNPWTSSGSLTTGSFTNNGANIVISGGPVSMGAVTANGPMTFNTSVTMSSYTANGGSTTTINGTATISGSVSANGPITFNGTATIGGSYTANGGGTTAFNGGGSIGGSFTNNTTVTVDGSMTVGGSMTNNGGGVVRETGSGSCYSFVVSGSLTNYGTFDGGGSGFMVTPAPSSGTMSNGAYSSPTQQPTTLTLALSGTTMAGTFTSPNASIPGYIVLRYVGSSATSDNPANNTSYSVGDIVGASTVVAIVTGGSTGLKSFTDVITTAVCNKTAYYRIFSYGYYGSCPIYYDISSPLTGSKLLTSSYVTITPSGATTFCSGGSVTLIASSGTAYAWNATAGSATTASVSATASGTYTVTVTTGSCTASASQSVTVNTAGTTTPYLKANGGALTNTATASICQGQSIEFSPQPAGTWTFAGPNGYRSYTRDTILTNMQPSYSGTYTGTYYNANGCTAIQNFSLTVNATPSVTVTAPSGPQCAGTSATLSATPGTGGSYTYSWSGPASYTATGASVTIASPAVSQTGTYTVTITSAASCSATASGTLTVVSCVSISGAIFDDANGNGIQDAGDTATSLGQTLYGLLIDSATNHVLGRSAVSAAGAFTFSNILPNKSGMRIAVNTSQPTIGAASPGYSWPSRWVGTLARYGTNNLSGTGVYTDTSQLLPIHTGTVSVTGILIGYDRLPVTSSRMYTIDKPALNSTKRLTSSNGMGLLSATDPEDGVLGYGKKFTITDVSGLNGNKMYYDADGNGTLASYERITGYTVINAFDSSKLYITFSGLGSRNATFKYNTADAAGKTDAAPSPYNITWAVSLPVKLVSFEAIKDGDRQALLKWTTASEVDNDHFDIERAADAYTWEKIGEVKGAGNSNTTIDYSLTDYSPLSGANYYRLKQVDYDGRYDYSDIQVVTIGDAVPSHAVMNIYPNPVSTGSGLNIVLSGPEDAIRYIRLTNQMGQSVYTSEVPDEQSHRIAGIDLTIGIYTVNVITVSGMRYSNKMVVR